METLSQQIDFLSRPLFNRYQKVEFTLCHSCQRFRSFARETERLSCVTCFNNNKDSLVGTTWKQLDIVSASLATKSVASSLMRLIIKLFAVKLSVHISLFRCNVSHCVRLILFSASFVTCRQTAVNCVRPNIVKHDDKRKGVREYLEKSHFS